MTACCKNVDGILHPSLTIISSEVISNLTISYYSDNDETSSSVTVFNYFRVIYQSFSSIEHLFFSSDFFIYWLDFSVFDCLSLVVTALTRLLPSVLFRSYSFLYFFRFCECLLPWIRLGFHFEKHWYFTQNLVLSLAWMLVTVYKIEFTSRKSLITFTCSLLYTRIRILLFSLKHMACHVFTHEISDWNKHLSHNVFSVCPNWATLL